MYSATRPGVLECSMQHHLRLENAMESQNLGSRREVKLITYVTKVTLGEIFDLYAIIADPKTCI